MTQKWAGYPNLRLRPVKPPLGCGRLQIQVRRAFLATGDGLHPVWMTPA
jgi:hypothetical protein